MRANRLTPILNVSDIQQSFRGSRSSAGKKGLGVGHPPTFGGVCSGECEIFLCQNAQGGRGKSASRMTFGPEGDESAEKAVWMSIWVDDVDEVYRAASSKVWRLPGLRPTCSGTLARCTCGTRTGTFSGSAEESSDNEE